jgi:hypothetical protein
MTDIDAAPMQQSSDGRCGADDVAAIVQVTPLG